MKRLLLGRALLGTGLAGAVAVSGVAPAANAQADAEPLTATFIGAEGQELGTATLTQTTAGVLVEVELEGLPPGEHGFHFHETGSCEAAGGFESAGGHYAPRGHDHGFVSENGPHAGDMPNQFAGEDGTLRAHVLNAGVTLGDGEATLLDSDGSALVVHAGADDYQSQPSGEAGDRLACAEIARP